MIDAFKTTISTLVQSIEKNDIYNVVAKEVTTRRALGSSDKSAVTYKINSKSKDEANNVKSVLANDNAFTAELKIQMKTQNVKGISIDAINAKTDTSKIIIGEESAAAASLSRKHGSEMESPLSSSGMAASIIVLLLLILALVSAAVWWNYHPAAPKLPQRPPSMVMFETHSKRRGSENYTNPLTFKEEKFIELPPRPQKIN